MYTCIPVDGIRILEVFVVIITITISIVSLLSVQAQYDTWPLRSITNYEVEVEPNMELVAPRAAAGQLISGREFNVPIEIGRGDIASSPSNLTWRAPPARTMAIISASMFVPVVHGMTFAFPSRWWHMSRRR